MGGEVLTFTTHIFALVVDIVSTKIMSYCVMVSTTDFDSVSPSSNLGGTTTKHGGCSSVGRAKDCDSFGRWFESSRSPRQSDWLLVPGHNVASDMPLL